MKSAKEFEQFFTFKLKPRLEELEEKRKAVKSIHNFKTYGRILLILLVLIIIDVVLVKKGFLPEFMFAFVFISVVFALVYPFVVLYYKGANFIPINEEYKLTVI
jgi:pheromone shutdown protein TraB